MVTIRHHALVLAQGRIHPRSRMVEFTVYLSPQDAEVMRERASYNDRSVSEQIRRDVRAANKTPKNGGI